MKRLLGVILCLVLILAVIPTEVSAATVRETLDSISSQSRYAPGSKEFGENGCWNFVNEVSQKLFGVGIPNKPSGYLLTGSSSYWNQTGLVFDSGATDNAVINLLKTACAGDIIQYKNSYATWQHTAMVYDVTSTGVTIYDSPNPTKGVSKVTYTWNKVIDGIGKFGGNKGYGISLYHCTKNPLSPSSPPTISVNFTSDTTDQSRFQAGYTNAVLATTITTSGVSISSVSSVGVYLYNSSGTQLGYKTEKPYPAGNQINAWYDVNSELNITLTKGTKYLYKFVAVINGTTYSSSTYSFTTLGASTVTVYFDANGGSVSTTSKSVTVNGRYGTLPTPTRAGYTFESWNFEKNPGAISEYADANSVVSRDTNHTLYAQWQANSYTVTLNANGGSVSSSSHAVTYNSKYGAKANLPTPTRTGYTFIGWYTAASGGTSVTDSTVYTTAGNTTLYAHWSGVACWMLLHADGAEVEKYQHLATYGETYDSINPFPIPVRSGYTFQGWYTEDGKLLTNKDVCKISDSPMSNRTNLYARWSRDVALGDLNSDTRIDANDALIVLKYAVDKVKLTEQQKQLADVNDSNSINAVDALLILQKAVDIIEKFPIEQ